MSKIVNAVLLDAQETFYDGYNIHFDSLNLILYVPADKKIVKITLDYIPSDLIVIDNNGKKCWTKYDEVDLLRKRFLWFKRYTYIGKLFY